MNSKKAKLFGKLKKGFFSSKKGMSPEFLVGLIATAAFLGIALFFMGPAILKLLFGSAETGQCNIQFILTHLGETSQLESCKMHDIIVTPEVLYKEMTAGKTEHAALKKADALGRIENTFDPSRPGADEAWALNRMIAKEMASCYEKTLGGKVLEKKWLSGAFSTDTVCVICARITLTPEAVNVFKSTDFNKHGKFETYLDYWMDEVPYKKGKMLYADYVQQALVINTDASEEIQKMYQTITTLYPSVETDMTKSMAVVLVNMPFGTLIGLSDDSDMRWIQVYPYEKLAQIEFLTGGVPPETKCKTIIGA